MAATDLFLVFDLNGTLLRRVKADKERMMALRNPEGRLPGCNDLIYVRPHLSELLAFLHEQHIPYVFWTTAMEHNAVHLLEAITSRGMNQHRGSFFFSHATPIPEHPYKRLKDLAVVAAKYQIPLANIRLVDDEVIKCSSPELHIPIDEYNPENAEDTALLSLITTLTALIAQEEKKPTEPVASGSI